MTARSTLAAVAPLDGGEPGPKLRFIRRRPSALAGGPWDDKSTIWRLCRPSLEEFQRECFALALAFGGEQQAAYAVGVSAATWYAWAKGRYAPSEAARRAVWFMWVLVLHPERIQTVFDILTWGRFSTRSPLKRGKGRLRNSFASVTEDWSI